MILSERNKAEKLAPEELNDIILKGFNVGLVKGFGAGNLFYICCHLAQLIARMETGGSRDRHENVDKMSY